ncbi:MAG: biopolymer transporter ExbD [Deltaproteobacteria bacterium]|nr:biopolymer transporter ExbD [Deltaproteobacteria bacterium]MBW2072393.1 biopolymer transporter ExbD [Deltaproteobacteria bacterium]
MRLPTPFFDVFCLLMGIFLLYNQMLAAYFNESPEKTLPQMDLAAITEKGSAKAAHPEALTISMKSRGRRADDVAYFINEQKSKFAELREKLKALSPDKVILRVDKNIPHGLVLEVIALCQNSGVENVSFSYKSKKR